MLVRMDRGIFWATLAVATISVGMSVRSLLVLAGTDPMPMTAAASGVAATPQAGAAVDLAAVIAFAPFGQAETFTERAAPAPDTETTALTLMGITLSQTAAGSRAIIVGADGVANSYGPGQVVTPGVVLTEIRADHVLIATASATEILRFPKGDTPMVVETATRTDGPDLANLIPATSAPVPAVRSKANAAAMLTAIKAGMRFDPTGYVAGLGLQPVTDGYLATAALSGPLRQAGLLPGDLVTLVNDTQPGDPARDLAILDIVATAGTAILSVRRDGQNLTLAYPLEGPRP